MHWMVRLKREFDIDLRQCPNCGGRLRMIGEVTATDVIARILEYVKACEPGNRGAHTPPVLFVSKTRLAAGDSGKGSGTKRRSI